jgi:hypothetical protein
MREQQIQTRIGSGREGAAPFSRKKLTENERTRSMNTNQALANQSKSGDGQKPTNMQRRTLIGGAFAALLASPGRALADENEDQGTVGNPFILLLKGVYEPVHLPNLGLSGVNLSDTSYMKTRIYPIYGVPGEQDQNNTIGWFYGSFSNPVCVYDLPGGAIAMSFASGLNSTAQPTQPPGLGFNTFVPFSDNAGGNYLEGTFELGIVDATGIYKPFKGGHNHMV